VHRDIDSSWMGLAERCSSAYFPLGPYQSQPTSYILVCGECRISFITQVYPDRIYFVWVLPLYDWLNAILFPTLHLWHDIDYLVT
jgi:hypothetical protein